MNKKKKEKNLGEKPIEYFYDLWDKQSNACVIGSPQKGREHWKNIFEQIMANIFPKLMKIINPNTKQKKKPT